MRVELQQSEKVMEEEISRLRGELEVERAKKANRERYSALAKVIALVTSRPASQKEIESIQRKIASLEAEGEALARRKENLGKHFSLLTQAVDDLGEVFRETKRPRTSPTRGGEPDGADGLEEGEEKSVGVGDRMEVEEGEEEEGERS
mmetsp:Transcript_603/g.2027  ORF Transcript_603/g.2027 Transcript_603/m.2027 type:complete len:148 (+) Transcript_603:144-587(+)